MFYCVYQLNIRRFICLEICPTLIANINTFKDGLVGKMLKFDETKGDLINYLKVSERKENDVGAKKVGCTRKKIDGKDLNGVEKLF